MKKSPIHLALILIAITFSHGQKYLKFHHYDFAWREIGKSVENRPLQMAEVGNGPKKILLIGTIHGNEIGGKKLLELLCKHLQKNPDEYYGKRLLIIPVANPDGFVRKTRGNSNGVDINRNFPTRDWNQQAVADKSPGPSAGSEPETLALVKVIETERPDVLVSIHQPLECINFDGPAEDLANKLVETTGLPLMHDIGYRTPGSLGTYAGVERNIPTVTIELPWKINQTDMERKYLQALLTIIRDF